MRYLNIAVALAFWVMLEGCSPSDAGDDAPTQTPPPPPAIPPPEDPPSTLFVLGDSLSDVGNLAAAADNLLSLALDPPSVGLCNPVDVLVLLRPCDNLFYRQSRVSDGPVAVEYLAAHFGLAELVPSLHFIPGRPVVGTGYAVASAKALWQDEDDLSPPVEMLLLYRV